MWSLEYDALVALRREHPAWKLLAADHAPLVVSSLYRHFVQPNVRVLPRSELISRLDDELFRLNEERGEPAFPQSAAYYLDDWAADGKGWLRKFYPAGTDEPHYDLTPATEKVIDWIAQLGERHFVGTESRLLTVFELLRQMAEGTQVDADARIVELEKRRDRIDDEIRRIRAGHLSLMDPTQVRDRFLQMAGTARGLLSDFRDVEQNFRDLDRMVREQITTWDEGRGALLDVIFGDRDAIEESDQGRSFRAFWDFLMSPDRQQELSSLLATVLALEPVRSLDPDPRLARIHYDWLEAGEVAQRTVARLSEQLRRFLDDQAVRENRRILQILRGVEQHALAIRAGFPDGPDMEIDEARPAITLDMDRLLFSPPFNQRLEPVDVTAANEIIPADDLFDQRYVDTARLQQNLRRAFRGQTQITLAEVTVAFPLEEGLAELVAYLNLASSDERAAIDDSRQQTIRWTDEAGRERQATIPLVVFVPSSTLELVT